MVVVIPRALLLGTLAAACVASQAVAQADTDNGRSSLSQSTDGFVRLDRRTGAVSNCASNGSSWACSSAPDERAALDSEVGRLQAENARLKAELAKRDALAATTSNKISEPLPKSDLQITGTIPPEGPSKGSPDQTSAAKIPEGAGQTIAPRLPDDRAVDRVMTVFERAWRRLIEMVSRVQ